jgi:hypothetical protein
LLGNANWYLPSWLQWLPDVRIDHEAAVQHACFRASEAGTGGE